MRPEFFLARQQLRMRWKQTLVSVLSVSVGVMILTTALSLTNGFESDMVDKILGTTPHISLKPGLEDLMANYPAVQRQLARHPEIKVTAPLLKEQALIRNPVHTTGTLIYGIRPSDAETVMKRYLQRGTLDGKQASVVVGSELAKKLQLFMGDDVQIITVHGTSDFRVTGTFHSGLYELDARIVLMPLDQTQQIYQAGNQINEIFVQLKDVFSAPVLAKTLQSEQPTLYVRTWMDSNQSLLSAMALEKKVIFLVILFIIIVAMMGIAKTQVMIVMEKTVDIGILRALGASRAQIGRVFLTQGLLIGVSGVVLGAVLGVGCSLYLSVFPVRIPGDIYDLDYLPVKMEILDFVWVAGSSLVITILASFFPARRAVRTDPIETLRRHI
jgi:lipoprotein-releasing system permease protein